MATKTAPMTEQEIRDLPASVDANTAARALGVGARNFYRLAAEDALPFTVLRIGKQAIRFRRADILEYLGISDAA